MMSYASTFAVCIASSTFLIPSARAGHTAGNRLNIVETAVEAGSFATLVAALEAAGLAEALQGEGPFTVFAPTDEAFDKLPKETVRSLLEPANRDKLQSVLRYHVITGRVTAVAATAAGAAETMSGSEIRVALRDGQLRVNDARVTANDLETSNGIIHVIDTVLIPPGFSTERAERSPHTLIELAISRGVPLFNNGQPAACAAIYEVTVEALLTMPPEKLDTGLRRELAASLEKARSEKDAGERAWILRRGLDLALSVIESEPRTSLNDAREAPGSVQRVGGKAIAQVTSENGVYRCGPCTTKGANLPVGYPAPTAPGAIEIKHYPRVRRAEVTVPGGPGDESASAVAFFPLFRHISSNDIAMTAPVEMDFNAMESGEPTATMSFLYETPDAGPVGDAGAGVTVRDTDPVTVLSLGIRGKVDKQRFRQAVAQLETWVRDSGDWTSTRRYRWLGYNGPYIPQENQWYEVQVVITPAD